MLSFHTLLLELLLQQKTSAVSVAFVVPFAVDAAIVVTVSPYIYIYI